VNKTKFRREKTMKTLIVIFAIFSMLAIASGVQAATWQTVGTSTGGIAVYYNTVAQGAAAENPYNQAYYKAQLNSSTTQTNGAVFAFSSALAPIFGDQGQYGFDIVVQAATNNGNVPTPILNAYDNVDNSLANRALAGPVTWAINDYKDGSGGPSNAANGIVNSILRGGSGTVSFSNVTPITGGWQITFTADLLSDGRFHWYNPAYTDNLMSAYAQNGQWWSGNFRASGTLTYLTANDTTAGMDFYSGPVTVEAQVVPEPATMCLLGLGGLLFRKRK
jgi:hypothetical protein